MRGRKEDTSLEMAARFLSASSACRFGMSRHLRGVIKFCQALAAGNEMKDRDAKGKTIQFLLFVTVRTFSISILPVSLTVAFAGVNPDTEITVRVNENGFFDERGRLLGPRNPLKVPEGKVVRITFVFDEKVTSLAIGDAHQIAIIADDGWSVESETIWMFNKQSGVTFRAGENGRTRYRGYCMFDCIGMEYLINLVIEVV